MNDFVIGKSRALAIGDGFLIDVSEMAKETGFITPVAITIAAWVACIDCADKKTNRLWSLLCRARVAAYSQDNEPHCRFFEIVRLFSHSKDTCRLKMTCSPGDFGEPVITIALQNE